MATSLVCLDWRRLFTTALIYRDGCDKRNNPVPTFNLNWFIWHCRRFRKIKCWRKSLNGPHLELPSFLQRTLAATQTTGVNISTKCSRQRQQFVCVGPEGIPETISKVQVRFNIITHLRDNSAPRAHRASNSSRYSCSENILHKSPHRTCSFTTKTRCRRYI